MNYQEMLKEARQNLNGSCKVCKACNGVACSGEVPGMEEKELVLLLLKTSKAYKMLK